MRSLRRRGGGRRESKARGWARSQNVWLQLDWALEWAWHDEDTRMEAAVRALKGFDLREGVALDWGVLES